MASIFKLTIKQKTRFKLKVANYMNIIPCDGRLLSVKSECLLNYLSIIVNYNAEEQIQTVRDFFIPAISS